MTKTKKKTQLGRRALKNRKKNDPRGYVPPPDRPARSEPEAPSAGPAHASKLGKAKRGPSSRRVPPGSAAARGEPEAMEPKRAERETAPVHPPVEPAIEAEGFRAGQVAIVGRPNVGKSTLLNALLGRKIAAATHKPQTTRRNLLGVLHPQGAEIALYDTPGYHRAKGGLNRFMVGEARSAMAESDLIAYVVEAREDGRITPGNTDLVNEIRRSEKPIIVLVNKIDRLTNKNAMLTLFQTYADALGERVVGIIPISAARRDGLEEAVKAIGAALPPGEPRFDPELFTDATERNIVAELIREKVVLETKDELPYATAVSIDAFEDGRPDGLVRIHATIHVERTSQKGIIIGRGGQRLKEIGRRARHEVEDLLDARVYLELFVRVDEGWSTSKADLLRLGYGESGSGEGT